jgi:hypothetical protein
MSVNLSPLGGAGAQFFTNDGVPLTGGLLYTYLAGTSTPATTYTSSSGITALANPIILDAAGRVPTGEIWLTDGINYKFVLKDSTDVLIATWDGLSGINSNFIAYTAQEETATATAGQTVFTTTITYIPATNNLAVYVNGSNQIVNVNYTETDGNTVTFLTGLNVGDVVKFSTASPVATNAVDASNVAYTPAGATAVTTDVQTKLRESVSVEDFGAVGDGVTDDTAAIQAALDTGKDVIFTSDSYLISASLVVASQKITGQGSYQNRPQSQIKPNGNFPAFINDASLINTVIISGFFIYYGGSAPTVSSGNDEKYGFKISGANWLEFSKISNCTVLGGWGAYYDNVGTYQTILEQVFSWNCRTGFTKAGGTTIEFNTCFAQGGQQHFNVTLCSNVTLINCAGDQAAVTTASPNKSANYFSGINCLQINGFTAESNTVTGDACAFMNFQFVDGTVNGVNSYSNTISCTTGESVHFIYTANYARVTFGGITLGNQNPGSTDPIIFSGAGGNCYALRADSLAQVVILTSRIQAPQGGTPTNRYAIAANGTVGSEGSISYSQSNITGTILNAYLLDNQNLSGTWTPTLNSFTTTGTYTTTGNYTRNGNLVTVWASIVAVSSGTIASTALTSAITGLPFPVLQNTAFSVSSPDVAAITLGNGYVNTSELMYTPTWSAINGTIVIQCSYLTS